MAEDKAQITIEFDGKNFKLLDDAKKGMTDIDKESGNLGKSFTSLAGVVKGVLAAAITGVLIKAAKECIDAFAESELATIKLNQALANAGNYSEKASKQLLSYASQMQSVTAFEDDAIVNAEAMIASFGFEANTVQKLTSATLDLAAAKGMDLSSAADLVAKSVGSSTNAMVRYGVELEGVAGTSDRAQSAIEGITRLFGGQALAQASSMAGLMAQLKNKFNDFLESAGQNLAPTAKIIIAALSALMDVTAVFFEYINSEWGNLFTWMGEISKSGMQYIGQVFDIGLDHISRGIKAVFSEWGLYLAVAAQAMTGNVLGAWETFKVAQAANSVQMVDEWQITLANLDAANAVFSENAKINWDGIYSTINQAMGKITTAIKTANSTQTQDVKNTTAQQMTLFKNHWAEVVLGKKLESDQLKALDQSTSDAFGNIASTMKALGRDYFNAWKAFAIAKATVDTYMSANAAFAALAWFPPAAAIAAAAAVAAGLANVYTIAHTELPAAELGGLIPGSPMGTPLIAGEKNKSEAIIPLDSETQRRIGIGGETTINVYVENMYADDAEIPARIAAGIDEALEKRRSKGESIFGTGLATQMSMA